jgi:tetratricopeptide (TPR) repeat protein
MKALRRMAAVSFALAITIAAAPRATAQATNDAFQQAMVEYQKSLGADVAAKIIKLVATMDQPPAIPEEARRHFVRGSTLFKDAKTAEDFSEVANEFKEATQLAPWWPEARYNYALVLEAAGQYALAINALYLYRAFKLPDAEARAVQDKIYALQARQEKASRESSAKMQVAAADSKSNAASLTGTWRQVTSRGWDEDAHLEFQNQGKQILITTIYDKSIGGHSIGERVPWIRFQLDGARIIGRWVNEDIPVTGDVNQNLDEIHMKWALPGITGIDGQPSYWNGVMRRYGR